MFFVCAFSCCTNDQTTQANGLIAFSGNNHRMKNAINLKETHTKKENKKKYISKAPLYSIVIREKGYERK